MNNPAIRHSLAALTAIASLAGTAHAQGAIIVRPGTAGALTAFGGIATTFQNRLPIGDDALREMIERYEPGALIDDVELTHITIVLDNANTYVKSLARTARMVQAEPGQVVVIRGDSTGAFIVPRIDTDTATTGGRVIAISGLRRADAIGEPSNGLMGTGYAASEVETVSVKRFAAGSLGKGQLFVTVLRLK